MIRSNILLQSNLIYAILTFFIILYVVFFTTLIKYDTKLNLNDTVIEGKVINYLLKEDKLSVTLKSKEKIQVTYYITEKENEYYKNNSLYGKTIIVEGKFKLPLKNSIPNTFNYKKYLYNKKIYTLFTANKITVVDNENMFYVFKNKISNKINNYKSSNFLKLFILGNKEELDPDTYNTYKTNGIAHLLAISGMHVSFLLVTLDKVLYNVNKKRKIVILSSFLLIYSFLTSFAVSIMRCFIFFILKESNELMKYNLNSFKLLFLTAFILLIYNPFYVYDIGFLYSFTVTFGLVFNKESTLFKTSLIAFLFSFPITAFFNYEINLSSVLINIICVPIITYIVFPLSIVALVLPFLDNLVFHLGSLFEILNNFLLNFSLILNIPKMNFYHIVIIYIFIILYMKLKQKIYLILICLTIVTIKTIPILDSSYYVIYFDVGQGDSAALVSPFKKEVVLIDTGGIRNYNISDNTILYLKSIGVSKINTLIISHGDFDHCGDIFNINKKMKIKSIILNNNFVNDLEKSILNLNIKRIESVQLNYFNSVNLNLHTSQDENDSSLVFNFQINFINFLFTGDISIKYMENIIKENSLTTNVLKVAHHGSKYNTSNFIIESLKPSYAVISSGRGNWYNHPHEQTLQILNNENVKVFNTQEGSVIFKINKNSYKVFTENI